MGQCVAWISKWAVLSLEHTVASFVPVFTGVGAGTGVGLEPKASEAGLTLDGPSTSVHEEGLNTLEQS